MFFMTVSVFVCSILSCYGHYVLSYYHRVPIPHLVQVNFYQMSSNEKNIVHILQGTIEEKNNRNIIYRIVDKT